MGHGRFMSGVSAPAGARASPESDDAASPRGSSDRDDGRHRPRSRVMGVTMSADDGDRAAGPDGADAGFAQAVVWEPSRPRLKPLRLVVALLVGAVAVWFASAVLPGVHVRSFLGAIEAAAFIGILNAILPPIVAAVRLPFTLIIGLLISAASLVLQVILGVDDDDAYSLSVIARIARRQGEQVRSDRPGILFLEIDGLATQVLRRAMRDGTTPVMARWLEDGSHDLLEWETDLSSQTGASQAGILLGSNHDIPAFRWVEKETGKLMTCSAPADCAEIERRHASRRGLLV